MTRRERENVEVLQRRLDWLHERMPEEGMAEETRFYYGAFPGEAAALRWAISLITGGLEPIDLKLERHERRIRNLEQRIGRMEHEWEGDE